jgi:hypothetical protein
MRGNDSHRSNTRSGNRARRARSLSWLVALPLVWPAAMFGATGATESKSVLQAEPRGWVDILPDANLKGWARVAPISTAGVKSLVDPKVKVWAPGTKPGILDCRAHLPAAPPGGKGGSHEMLRYEKELEDFIFHVEWRFVDPERKGWNAGVYARVNETADVWHQAQVGGGAGGHWFGDTPDATGKIVRIKAGPPLEQRVKPAGEWNTYEITARGDRLSLWVNGATVSELTGLRILRGHIGLEAELHHIEFRNLKLKELPR